MKRVIFYKVYVCYTGYVYDLADIKFRDYLISSAEHLKDSSYSTRIKYLTDKDAHNVDGHYSFSNVMDERNLAIVSWAEIDKSFDYNQAIDDLKTIIYYHDAFCGHQSERNLQSILEMICQFNEGG